MIDPYVERLFGELKQGPRTHTGGRFGHPSDNPSRFIGQEKGLPVDAVRTACGAIVAVRRLAPPDEVTCPRCRKTLVDESLASLNSTA